MNPREAYLTNEIHMIETLKKHGKINTKQYKELKTSIQNEINFINDRNHLCQVVYTGIYKDLLEENFNTTNKKENRGVKIIWIQKHNK